MTVAQMAEWSDDDLPFEPMWLHESQILTPDYQRPPSVTKIAKIVKHGWDANAGFPLGVSKRVGGPDAGKYFVWNGQHRLAAARRLKMEWMYCAVSSLTRKQEAELYGREHENATHAKPLELFRALLVAENVQAIALNEIVEQCGFAIDFASSGKRHAGYIGAIGALESLARTSGREGAKATPRRLKMILSLIREAWPSAPGAANAAMLGALDTFMRKYHDLVDRKRLLRVLSENDPRDIANDASKLMKLRRRNAQDSLGEHILDLYNHGLSTRRLPPWDSQRLAPPDIFEHAEEGQS